MKLQVFPSSSSRFLTIGIMVLLMLQLKAAKHNLLKAMIRTISGLT